MVYHDALIKQTIIAKKSTNDDETCERLDSRVSFSRSWLLALFFLFVGPFFAFKSGLSSIKQNNKNITDNAEEELNQSFLGSLYFSNPIVMTMAAILSLIGFAVGAFILFSIISLMAITANDNQKLANTNFVAPARCVISKNINNACQILSKHMKQKHS